VAKNKITIIFEFEKGDLFDKILQTLNGIDVGTIVGPNNKQPGNQGKVVGKTPDNSTVFKDKK
jgi:hypothetical protein